MTLPTYCDREVPSGGGGGGGGGGGKGGKCWPLLNRPWTR